MKLFLAITLLTVLASAKTLGPLYPQRVFTQTLLYNTPWTTSYCLEDGTPGSVQGRERQQYDAVQPCTYGQVRLGTGGDYLEFGAIGGVASAVADLGTYSTLGTTLNATERLPYATNFLGISVCGKDLCAASNRSGHDDTIMRHPVHFTELLTTTSHGSLTPKIGHVYIVRLTDGEVTTENIIDKTTLLAKFTVNQAAAGIYHFSWTVFFGEINETPKTSSNGGESSDDRRHKNEAQITVAEALSISSLTLSAIAICAVVFTCVVLQRSRSSSGYAPINH